jgi:hypothetical protein
LLPLLLVVVVVVNITMVIQEMDATVMEIMAMVAPTMAATVFQRLSI